MVKICIKNTRASFKNYSKMIHKSFKQLNAERAAMRARLSDYLLLKNSKRKKYKKSSSARAGGPSPEESGFKPASLTVYKL